MKKKTLLIKLQCEEEICDRCSSLWNETYCRLFNRELKVDKNGNSKRCNKCKNAEIL
jgi:hypothetical protein